MTYYFLNYNTTFMKRQLLLIALFKIIKYTHTLNMKYDTVCDILLVVYFAKIIIKNDSFKI